MMESIINAIIGGARIGAAASLCSSPTVASPESAGLWARAFASGPRTVAGD